MSVGVVFLNARSCFSRYISQPYILGIGIIYKSCGLPPGSSAMTNDDDHRIPSAPDPYKIYLNIYYVCASQNPTSRRPNFYPSTKLIFIRYTFVSYNNLLYIYTHTHYIIGIQYNGGHIIIKRFKTHRQLSISPRIIIFSHVRKNVGTYRYNIEYTVFFFFCLNVVYSVIYTIIYDVLIKYYSIKFNTDLVFFLLKL